MRIEKLAVAMVLGSLALLGAGCSDNDFNSLQGNGTTADVLKQSRTSLDSATPYSINDGAFSFNDTSETSDPLAINL